MDDDTASVGEIENWIQLLLQDGPAAARVTLIWKKRLRLEGRVNLPPPAAASL